MNYYLSNEVAKHKLYPILGEAVKTGIRGSANYFVKSFKAKEEIPLIEDSKGIFQVFTKGLLFRGYKNNRFISLPIPFNSINKFELLKGAEKVQPIFLSPMWILLKLGISLEYARYFRIRISEYSVGQTQLILKTAEFIIELETSGYSYESQERFFKKLI